MVQIKALVPISVSIDLQVVNGNIKKYGSVIFIYIIITSEYPSLGESALHLDETLIGLVLEAYICCWYKP